MVIEEVIDTLEWLPDHDARAAHFYSLSKLTAGLPHREAIITMALEIRNAQKAELHPPYEPPSRFKRGKHRRSAHEAA